MLLPLGGLGRVFVLRALCMVCKGKRSLHPAVRQGLVPSGCGSQPLSHLDLSVPLLLGLAEPESSAWLPEHRASPCTCR